MAQAFAFLNTGSLYDPVTFSFSLVHQEINAAPLSSPKFHSYCAPGLWIYESLELGLCHIHWPMYNVNHNLFLPPGAIPDVTGRRQPAASSRGFLTLPNGL